MVEHNTDMNYDDARIDDQYIHQVLADYHRKQCIENLTGPGISLISHIIILILGFACIITSVPPVDPPLKAETLIIEKLKLDPEIEEEIEEIEEEIEDELTVEPIDAPPTEAGEQTSPADVSDDRPETDDDTETDEALDTVLNQSPLHFPSTMGGRTPSGRKNAIGKVGSGLYTRRGQDRLNRALKWLRKVQNPNGSWGTGNGWSDEPGHPAHTGIALLVFMAHGETPSSKHFGKTVQGAIRWLVNYASQSDLGSTVKKRPGAYAHGIATYALSEAYAMTKVPFLQSAMENAISHVIEGQMPNGGFGYGYTSGPRWDTSVAGWNMQALKAARMAGCRNPKLKDAINKSISFCRKVAYTGKGGFAYAHAKTKSPRDNMGGVGVVALQLMGAGDTAPAKAGVDRIGVSRFAKYKEVADNPGKWNEIGGECLYGWYYDTQAIFNTHDTDKARWKEWQKVFEKVLTRSQNPEGYWETNGKHNIGSHDTPGRVLSTCLAALQLEVYYRYLPTFDKSKLQKTAEEDRIDDIDGVGAGRRGGMIITIEE